MQYMSAHEACITSRVYFLFFDRAIVCFCCRLYNYEFACTRLAVQNCFRLVVGQASFWS